MNQYTESVSLSQVKIPLTKNQKAAIDRLMIKYPNITPADVRSHYEHYYYSRNWFVWIEVEGGHHDTDTTITRCNHAHTAAAKAKVIRAYIARALIAKGGQS
jgi:hypothetical protein